MTTLYDMGVDADTLISLHPPCVCDARGGQGRVSPLCSSKAYHFPFSPKLLIGAARSSGTSSNKLAWGRSKALNLKSPETGLRN